MLFRPLFLTGWLLEDFLRTESYFGAANVLISSASSKTSISLASGLRAPPLPPPHTVTHTHTHTHTHSHIHTHTHTHIHTTTTNPLFRRAPPPLVSLQRPATVAARRQRAQSGRPRRAAPGKWGALRSRRAKAEGPRHLAPSGCRGGECETLRVVGVCGPRSRTAPHRLSCWRGAHTAGGSSVLRARETRRLSKGCGCTPTCFRTCLEKER